MAARLGQVSAALIVNSGPQRHVVVHVVIQATSVDETGLESPVSSRNELTTREIGLGGRQGLDFGTVRPRVQIPAPDQLELKSVQSTGAHLTTRLYRCSTDVGHPSKMHSQFRVRALRPARSQGAEPSRSAPLNQSLRTVREVSLGGSPEVASLAFGDSSVWARVPVSEPASISAAAHYRLTPI